jgi:uncharacterized protein (TIGR03067 family)
MNGTSVLKLFSAVVCVALIYGCAVSRPDDPPAKGPADLQGCWKLVSIESDGKSSDPFGGGQPRWVIKGTSVSYSGEEIIKFTVDESTSPRIIDLKFRDPERVYEGVYVVEKNTLKVCLNGRSDAKDRPGVFSTTDQADWRMLVFEREKTAPANPTEGATAYAGIQVGKDAETKAVVVVTPIKGSPAEKAGLKKGDVVLKVGATEVTDVQGTIKAVQQAKPGEKLEFKISRDGKEQDITVKVGVLPFHYVVGLT